VTNPDFPVMGALLEASMGMTPDKAAALRAPFPESAIGKLPRVTCKRCSEAQGKVCDQHSKGRCDGCGNYMTTAHIHLDYVGHAAATDRLLQVDPYWTWEPMVTDPNTSAPLLTNGGLWIRLTICGVTRPGWGDGKDLKEMIGDAIRNAAMRFGVALDLWSRQDLDARVDEPDAPAQPSGPVDAEARQVALRVLAQEWGSEHAARVSMLLDLMDAWPDVRRTELKRAFVAEFGNPTMLSPGQLDEAEEWADAQVAPDRGGDYSGG
jgi:hypothetical protein